VATLGVFPAGPWPNDQPPPHLSWKVDLAAALTLVAFVIGVTSIAFLWRRRHQPLRQRALAARLALVGSAVFPASWPFEAIFLFQRSHEVAGSPSDAVVAFVTAALLAFPAAAVLLSARWHMVVRAAML
jgi:hypothetical protein